MGLQRNNGNCFNNIVTNAWIMDFSHLQLLHAKPPKSCEINPRDANSPTMHDPSKSADVRDFGEPEHHMNIIYLSTDQFSQD